tara:strand:+ start:158 stop:427 length:270 start_codon:yes stop_codon:yes gene_type:complete
MNQQSKPVDSTIEINQQIIDERNKEMEQISKDVEAVNQIYKDLAILIEEQGYHLNTIADNIESSLVETQGAVKELEKASKRQKLGCLVS